DLVFRMTYHDFLDPDPGYPRFSEVVGGNFNLRYTEDSKRIYFHQLDLVSVTSLTPVDEIHHQVSWTGSLGAYTPPDISCTNCLAARLNGGVGYSAYLAPENWLVYGLLKINFEDSSAFSRNFRLGLSLASGLILAVSEMVKVHVEAERFQ